MALSEEVALGIQGALAQLEKLDRALAKSLRAEVQLDTKAGLEKIKALRREATETLGKKIDVTLSTVAARAELGKLETSINALRKVAEKNIQIGVNRQTIDAQTRAVDRLSVAVDGYRTSAASAATSTKLLTRALEKQVVEAGLLSKELKEVVVSIEAISVAANKVKPVKLGPGRAELNQILREQKEFEQRIGRDIHDETLGPITAQRIEAIKTVEATELEAQAAVQRALKETAAVAKRAAAEQVAAAKRAATAAEAEAAKIAKAAEQGRTPTGALLGPINSGRVLAIQEEEKALKAAGVEADKIRAEEERRQKKAIQGIRALGAESGALNQQLIATGRSLTLLFTLPTVVAGAFAAFNEFKFQETIQRTKVLTDAFTKFDQTGHKVNLTAAETTARIGGLRDVFNSIATKTGQTPNDIAAGFYFVASAGGVAATRLSILRVAAEGAAIGLGSVEVVADTLTSVLNAYGEANITAASAGDILVRAVNDAKVEATDLAPQLGRVLPVAAQLGVNFAQVAESLALITQTGNSASTAATQLRGIFQSFVRPTSEKAAAILASVGLNAKQLREQIAQPTPTAFIDTLIRLRKVLPIEEFAQLFRRVDALNGALSLTNNEDAVQAFRDIADAAKNTSGDLQEFEHFAEGNQVLKIKQAFSQLLIQLQPLGQKTLPLVTKGLGTIVGLVDTLGKALDTPFLGPVLLGVGAVLAASGPLIFALGKVRQGIQAIGKVSTVLGTSGGFSRFLKGESVGDIKATAAAVDGTAAKVGLLGRAFGALPGLIGVAAAGGLAFFGGVNIASDDTKTRILGLAETLGAVTLAFIAARSAAAAFGVTSSLALGGVGLVAGLLVAGIAGWSAYKEATEKSRKALDEFEHSLEGLTANEAVKSFGASLTKSLEGITADDRVTQIEIPELRAALDGLGLSYEDLGKKLANVVLSNPDNLAAQKHALEGLAASIGGAVQSGRLELLQTQLSGVNAQVLQLAQARNLITEGPVNKQALETLAPTLQELGIVSDETRDSLIKLADKGFVTFANGGFQLTGSLDEMRAALGDTLGSDTLGLLNNFADAFRLARQSALETTGEFTLATNAAGSFVEVGDDANDTFVEFQENASDAAFSISAMTDALNKAVDAVFGLRDATTFSEATDKLTKLAETNFTTLSKARQEIEVDENGNPVLVDQFGKVVPTDENGVPKPAAKGSDRVLTQKTNEDFINFQVDLTSPEGRPAREFIRDQIDDIDSTIQAFLEGPDGDVQVGMQMRDDALATLAAEAGITVEDLNTFLAQDNGGLTTAQINARLADRAVGDLIKDIAGLNNLIKDSPLDIPTQIKVLDDPTGALFGSELLAKGLTDGKIVVDFIVNAIESDSVTLDQLQQVFGTAPVDVTRNFIINAINQGVDLQSISEAIAGIPPEVRTQLFVDIQPQTLPGGELDPDVQRAIIGGHDTKEIQQKINLILEGAEDFEAVQAEAVAGNDYTVDVIPETSEYDKLVAQIADGANLQVIATVEPGAYNAMIAQIKAGLASLGVVAGRPLKLTQGHGVVGGVIPGTAAGGVFNSSGFKQFRAGGMLNGYGTPREPMIAKVASNRRGILWGEPETHGEAYIPYNPARRVRAMALVSRVAKDFGMNVHTRQVSTHGATLASDQTQSSRDGREITRLAAEVATLAKVIEERETQPLIGEYHAESATTNPRATARYLATDLVKALAH